MRPACDRCGYPFGREPGYFLGSVYINYGLTALLVTTIFFVGFFWFQINPEILLGALTLFCVVFPLWFFRYAHSLWMGFDTFWDPPPLDLPPTNDKPASADKICQEPRED